VATLEVLEHTGFWIECEERWRRSRSTARRRSSKVVRIPGTWLRKLCAAPLGSYFAAATQDDIVLESNRVGFTNFGEGPVSILQWRGTRLDLAGRRRQRQGGRLLSDEDVYERAVTANDVSPEWLPASGRAWMTTPQARGFMGSRQRLPDEGTSCGWRRSSRWPGQLRRRRSSPSSLAP